MMRTPEWCCHIDSRSLPKSSPDTPQPEPRLERLGDLLTTQSATLRQAELERDTLLSELRQAHSMLVSSFQRTLHVAFKEHSMLCLIHNPCCLYKAHSMLPPKHTPCCLQSTLHADVPPLKHRVAIRQVL